MNKKIVSAAVCAALLMALMTGAFGASAARSIEVLYDDIQITLNGERVETADANGQPVEPFIYDGTTYIPARAVAEAFGKNVEWLPESGEVAITDADADSGADGNAGASEETLNDYLIARSRALTAEIAERADSGLYVRSMSYMDDLVTVASEISAGDYANPREAIIVKTTDSFLDKTTDILLNADFLGYSGTPTAEEYEYIRNKYFDTIPTMINGRHGSEVLAVTSMLTTHESYQSHRELNAKIDVILLHDGDYASWISFRPSKENTVMVRAQFVRLDEEMRGVLVNELPEKVSEVKESGLPEMEEASKWLEGLEIEVVDLTDN